MIPEPLEKLFMISLECLLPYNSKSFPKISKENTKLSGLKLSGLNNQRLSHGSKTKASGCYVLVSVEFVSQVYFCCSQDSIVNCDCRQIKRSSASQEADPFILLFYLTIILLSLHMRKENSLCLNIWHCHDTALIRHQEKVNKNLQIMEIYVTRLRF